MFELSPPLSSCPHKVQRSSHIKMAASLSPTHCTFPDFRHTQVPEIINEYTESDVTNTCLKFTPFASFLNRPPQPPAAYDLENNTNSNFLPDRYEKKSSGEARESLGGHFVRPGIANCSHGTRSEYLSAVLRSDTSPVEERQRQI